MTSDRVTVRLARSDDVSSLAAIESAGDAMFAAAGHPEFVGGETVDPLDLVAAVATGQLLVAELEGRVVGFALLGSQDDEAVLLQLSVLPAVGRQGIGTRLLGRSIEVAAGEGRTSMTLSTQTDVAWNAPWYERHGFVVVAESDWSEAMRAVTEHQTRAGLDWDTRAHMRLRVDPLS